MTTATQISSTKPSAEFLAAMNPKKAAAEENSIEITQDRFLKLLTTQLKNQDPLNPLDNAQMTSQMAQISTVSGIEKLNATLERLASTSSDEKVVQASAMLGREVLVEGNALSITTSKDDPDQRIGGLGGFDLAGAADQVKVRVFDANGLEVRSIDLGSVGAGVHSFGWNGLTTAGTNAVDGGYTFKVEATQGGKAVKATALQAGMVTGITRNGTDIGLQLANLSGSLGSVGVDAVKQVF